MAVHLHGLRGVGKTVLLLRLQHIVESAGWVTVQLEARPGGEARKLIARQPLARGIAMAGRNVMRFRHAAEEVKTALSSVTSFSATIAGSGISLGVEPSPHRQLRTHRSRP
jgi:hypothetical protein